MSKEFGAALRRKGFRQDALINGWQKVKWGKRFCVTQPQQSMMIRIPKEELPLLVATEDIDVILKATNPKGSHVSSYTMTREMVISYVNMVTRPFLEALLEVS